MFGSSKKSETFKYEVEVNSLIREAIAGLNQRVLGLEITNQQLIQHNQRLEFELQTLKQTLYTDVQRLEKRITDFTDLWHPIMSENINRIKGELEETIRNADREEIQKVSLDLENKLTKLMDERDSETLINTHIGLPPNEGKQIKLTEIVKKIHKYYNLFQRAPSINLFTITKQHLISIIDDNNKILIEGSYNSLDTNEMGKLMFDNENYYNVITYLNKNCPPIYWTTTNGYNTMTIFGKNMPTNQSITINQAINQYEEIKRYIIYGGMLQLR